MQSVEEEIDSLEAVNIHGFLTSVNSLIYDGLYIPHLWIPVAIKRDILGQSSQIVLSQQDINPIHSNRTASVMKSMDFGVVRLNEWNLSDSIFNQRYALGKRTTSTQWDMNKWTVKILPSEYSQLNNYVHEGMATLLYKETQRSTSHLVDCLNRAYLSLLWISVSSHLTASETPVPDKAEMGCTLVGRESNLPKPRCSCTSLRLKAPKTSCLFAATRMGAPCSSLLPSALSMAALASSNLHHNVKTAQSSQGFRDPHLTEAPLQVNSFWGRQA